VTLSVRTQGEFREKFKLAPELAEAATQNFSGAALNSLIFNTGIVSPGAHPDTRGPSRSPRVRSGSPESFSPGVDALGSGATGDDHTPGKTGK